MKNYLESIDRQIEFNKGKNIFADEKNSSLKFIDDTVNLFRTMSLSKEAEKTLISYVTHKSLDEFCRVNQYYTFNRQAKDELRRIYCELLSNIKNNNNSIKSTSEHHYENIREWLRKTNPFAAKIYSNAANDIHPVACSEYSAELQIDVLKVDLKTLKAPVLDIGCGRQGILVNYLNDSGIESFGIDRFSFSEGILNNADWLEYNYGVDKWGTIISNLGFSNHFKHHHLRADGNYIEYGIKYMEILRSLKVGGRFHYAPDLPFIEIYLDNKQYQIDKFEIAESDFKTSVVTRL